jgi:NitT/TauT family transport system permease protein
VALPSAPDGADPRGRRLARPGVMRYLRLAVSILVTVAAIVGAWILVKLIFSPPDYVLPSVGQVARAAYDHHSELTVALRTTAAGAFGGFLVGNAAGVIGAVIVASSVNASRVVLPMALVLRVIPVIALAPFLTLVLGRGLTTVAAVSALIVFFPSLVNGVLGFRSVDDEVIELMSILNASRWQTFFRIRLPASLPYLFAAFEIAAASSVLGAMVAEWAASGRGLGYLILQSGVQFDVALMWAGVILATLLALAAFGITSFLGSHFTPGRPSR